MRRGDVWKKVEDRKDFFSKFGTRLLYTYWITNWYTVEFIIFISNERGCFYEAIIWIDGRGKMKVMYESSIDLEVLFELKNRVEWLWW